jgi:Ca2+:H+ antiporter
MKIGPISLTWLDVLLVFVPVAVVLEIAHADAVWIFVAACLAIIPLAGWMGRATEHLAAHYGPGIGGLLNATFGNAAEMIIAIMALNKGLYVVVKASLTGSIIGNVLLVLGLSLLLGGMRHQRQRFNRTAASMASTLLALSAIGLIVPAMFHFAGGHESELPMQKLSLAIAVVLFIAYILGLVFQLKTHQHLFAEGHGDHDLDGVWSKKLAIGVLVGATTLVALMSEFLVGSVEHTAEAWGMTEVFVGVILVAIIGNAAEHSSAVIMAWKNKMDLSITIAVGSGIQIALFVAPVLVFLSYVIGPAPMDLDFTLFEVIAVWASVVILAMVATDGESHWMEGVLLLAVYIVLGIAFFFLPG